MADIKVSLGLDDSQYTAKLKAAENAAKSFGTANTAALNSTKSGFSSLSGTVAGLTDKMTSLAGVIAGVGFATLISDVIESADKIDDLSRSLGVNASRLQEMGAAAQLSGSSVDGLSSMLSKLEQNTQDALNGNDKLQASFEKIGITAGDIKSQSPDQLFYSIAKSLSEITDPAERTAKSIELLGKGAKGWDVAGFITNINQLYGSFDQYAESQKAAAELADQMALSTMLLKNEFLKLIAPIINIATSFVSLEGQFNAARASAIVLSGALAAIVGGAVITGLKTIVGAFNSLAAATGVATTATTIGSASAANYGRLLATFVAPSLGRVASAQGAVNVAQLQLNALMATGSATATQLTAATTALAAAEARLGIATEALALTSSQATAAIASTGAVAGGAAAGVGAAGAAATGAAVGFRAMAASVATAVGPITALIVAAGSLYAVGQALWGDNGIFSSTGDKSGANWISDLVGVTDSATSSTADLANAQARLQEDMKKSKEEAAKLAEEQKKFSDSEAAKGIRAQADQIRNATQSINDQQKAIRQKYTTEISMAGESKAAIEGALASIDAQNRSKQEGLRIDSEIKKLQLEMKDASDSKKSALNEQISALNAQRGAYSNIAKNAADLKDLELQRNGALAIQNSLLDAQKQQKSLSLDVEKAQAQVGMTPEQARANDIDFLIKKQQQLAVQEFENARGRVATGAEIESINKKIADAYEGVAAKSRELLELDYQRKAVLELQKAVTDAQYKAKEMELDLEKEYAQLTMSTSQRRLSDIDFMIKKEQDAAVKAFEEARGRKATGQEIIEIHRKIAQSYDGIKAKTEAVMASSRTFATGWKKALNEYKDEAGNAAKTAESLFKKATQGMEDAIVNFAKTGKFEWKGFVASMLEELLRSQIKSLFANLMGGMGDSLGGLMGMLTGGGSTTGEGASEGGGLGDIVSSLFGGGAQQGSPVFVTNWPTSLGGSGGRGGSGSSLWDSITGLFGGGSSSSGGATGAGWDLGTGMGNVGGSDSWANTGWDLGSGYNQPAPSFQNDDYDWFTGGSGSSGGSDYNYGGSNDYSTGYDLGSGYGGGSSYGYEDPFAGYFATGGFIPKNKYGIVGENGPELVSGPANVTPQTGPTSVTYNINAVDASSFKQMIAADPSFLHAVVMQGSKSMPA